MFTLVERMWSDMRQTSGGISLGVAAGAVKYRVVTLWKCKHTLNQKPKQKELCYINLILLPFTEFIEEIYAP